MALGLKFRFPSLCVASAHIVAKSFSKDKDGSILLTSECASIEELEANAASLHRDIDKAVSEAREQFAKSKAAGPQKPFSN